MRRKARNGRLWQAERDRVNGSRKIFEGSRGPMLKRLVSAITLAAAVSGCAHAYAPPSHAGGQQILSQLPADAPDGECYARVQVPGNPAPPQLQGAQWVQMPGPPGAPGPIWCLVPTGPQPVAFEAPRYGFVRVLCDDDYTPGQVTRLQQQLRQGGYYTGAYSGQYDAATAAAVSRFQSSRQIAHGGYLSMDTLSALDSAYAGQAHGLSYAYSGGYAAGGYGFAAGGISPCAMPCAMPAPPPPPPPMPPMPCNPCMPAAPPCNPCGGVVYGGSYGGGYGGGYSGGYATGYVQGGVLEGGVGYQGHGGGYYAGRSGYGYALPPAAYVAGGASYTRNYTVQGGGYSTWGGYRR